MAVLSKVAVFWDIENCAIPATVHGGAAVALIESVAREYGICSPFRAYSSVCDGISYQKKSDLITAGVSLIPTHVKMADHVLITDMLEWAFENPSSTIVLVTGDRDFSYTISLLRRRGIRVVLIAPKAAANSSLAAQAARVVEWNPASMMPKNDVKRKAPIANQATPSLPLPNIEDEEPAVSASSLPGPAPCPSLGHTGDATREHESTPPTEPAKASPGPSQLGLVLNPAIAPFVPKFAAALAAPNAQQGGWVVSVATNGPDVDVVTAHCSDELVPSSRDPALVPLPNSPVAEIESLPLPHSPETLRQPLPTPESVEPVPSPESAKPPLPSHEIDKPSLPSPEPSPAAAKPPLLPPGLEQHIQNVITPPSSHSTSDSELEEVDAEDKAAPVEAKPEAWLRPVQNQVVQKVQKTSTTPSSQPTSGSWRRPGAQMKYTNAPSKRINLRTVPTPYQPLVEALEDLAKKGSPRPLWSALGAYLSPRRRELFDQLGVTGMKEYLHSAQRAGWCLLGETQIEKGCEWIELVIPRGDSRTVNHR